MLPSRSRALHALALASACLAACETTAPSDRDAAVGRDGASLCASDDDCGDGRFCNGVERCAPASALADARGCLAALEVGCRAGYRCDEASDECTRDCDVAEDADGDGHQAELCGGDDCDDGDPQRFPGNVEVCDEEGRDEDCDPATRGPDADGDLFTAGACCNVWMGERLCGEDCDDARIGVNPAAAESCNGLDDDCDTLVDEGVLETFYRDRDGDGYGVSGDTFFGCAAPIGYAVHPGDCDDTFRAIQPSAADGPPSACDGIDNDCDTTVDEGCDCTEGAEQPCGPRDADTGAFIDVGACATGNQLCIAGSWSSCMGAVYPDVEACNSSDDDCDGTTDEGTRVPCYADLDDDGYAGAGATRMDVCPAPARPSVGMCPTMMTSRPPGAGTTDCHDASPAVRPGADEACNAVDDDCDGERDEGCACTTLTGGASRINLVLRGPTMVDFNGARFVYVSSTTSDAELAVRCAATGHLLAGPQRLTVGGTARFLMRSTRPFEMLVTLRTTHYEGFTFDVMQRTY